MIYILKESDLFFLYNCNHRARPAAAAAPAHGTAMLQLPHACICGGMRRPIAIPIWLCIATSTGSMYIHQELNLRRHLMMTAVDLARPPSDDTGSRR